MQTKGRSDLGRVSRFTMVLGLILAAAPLGRGADRAAIDQPIYDVVAVGRAPGKILLATPAVPAEKLVWRFREISVSPSDSGTVADHSCRSGTEALVIFSMAPCGPSIGRSGSPESIPRTQFHRNTACLGSCSLMLER